MWNYKRNLALKDRVYICDECGISIDRDYNASLNLLSQLKQKIGKVLADLRLRT
ncbi:zinc ribbon domain-containing protein [Campylobacter hyointestinalis]|uniref:zinc ribbon domain-containing protein n=1 Tax=Campylobacter hyointestinalis TaxID=198 RepID=UPI00403F2467